MKKFISVVLCLGLLVSAVSGTYANSVSSSSSKAQVSHWIGIAEDVIASFANNSLNLVKFTLSVTASIMLLRLSFGAPIIGHGRCGQGGIINLW
ncbi:hypothetical protein [Candidatus Endomicrobiellum devescovinae]|jgi:hypothetical protein|uniref:hypothetical protein n=1 Tax=Candidatus Endomicrobiellum devescovinae TaxID=3242322 RepID=UPI0028290523|nr:hypothetical protein [Endomicrobium sp.]